MHNIMVRAVSGCVGPCTCNLERRGSAGLTHFTSPCKVYTCKSYNHHTTTKASCMPGTLNARKAILHRWDAESTKTHTSAILHRCNPSRSNCLLMMRCMHVGRRYKHVGQEDVDCCVQVRTQTLKKIQLQGRKRRNPSPMEHGWRKAVTLCRLRRST